MATVGEAFVKILPDTSQFGKDAAKGVKDGLKETEKPVKETTDKISAEFAKVGKAIATAFVTQQIVKFAKDSIAAAEAAETSRARIEQVATSMNLFGNEVGKVTDRLVEYAEATARATGIDDDQIQLAQAKLLTFKNLAMTADEMGGAFDRATMAAIDMGAAGFGDAAGNAVQLGKALQDPIKGITALARSGITFTAEQKNVIRSLVETNQVAQAQDMILKAIEQQVGGTAVATANASDKMRVAYEELQEEVGKALLPAFQSLTDILIPLMSAFNALPGEVRNVISTIGISTAVTAGFSRTLQNLGVAAGVAKVSMGILNVAMIAFTLNAQRNAEESKRAADAMSELSRATDENLRSTLIAAVAARAFSGESMKAADILADLAKQSLGTADRLVELGIAQDVLGISTDDARAAIDAEVGAIQQQNEDLDRGTKLTNDAADATGNLGDAQDDTADATADLTDELREQEDALQDLLDATLSMFNSEINLERAKRDTSDAIGEYNTLLQQMETGTYEGSDAFRDIAEASEEVYQTSLRQAEGAVRVAEDTAKAAGASLSAEDANRILRDELLRVVATLDPNSPLRARLMQYVNELGQIPSSKNTDITTRYYEVMEQRVATTPSGMGSGRTTSTTTTKSTTTTTKPTNQDIVKKKANGGIITRPEITLMGEDGPEVVIPLTRRNRALELMRETGLDAMIGSRGATVNIESAVFNNGTDANLVAQKVNAAERARSFST